MTGRLGVDFGASNTVLAVWDDARGEGVPLHVPDYGHVLPQPEGAISVVPSLIHYGAHPQRWLGEQVLRQNLVHSRRTFRWMKRYIATRSPVRQRVDGTPIAPAEAGRDFLGGVLVVAAEELGLREEEVAFTVPVDAFEHYEDWLAGVAESAGMPRFRLIDEPSAAALGYGAHIQPGHCYLIFDFGGGTLDVALVLIEEAAEARAGRRCRVLGKAGAELGGMTIDQWLFQAVLRRNDRRDADDDIRALNNALLVECEQLKERLSFHPRAELTLVNPDTGAALGAELTREDLEALLDERGAFTTIERTVRAALNAARERGFVEDDIRAVLMVGGSSLIPAVQKAVQRMFGPERVRLERPLDAVARGAAAFVAGVDFYDHIQHDYAIRYVRPAKGEYDYRVLVSRGTPYPTAAPLARLTVKATHDGQARLGIAIFEIGERHARDGHGGFELVFDPSGTARVLRVTPDEEQRRTYFWMNEHQPTFLEAGPAVRQGEACYEVEFGIDGNKRLLVTARNLKTGERTHQDFPVVKLT